MNSAVPAPAKRDWRRLFAILAVGAVLIGSAAWFLTRTTSELAQDYNGPSVKRDLIESEALILGLTPRLKNVLATSVLNLGFRNSKIDGLFAARIDSNQLDATNLVESSQTAEFGITDWSWKTSAATSSVEPAEIWRLLFDQVDFFERAKFSIVRAEFSDPEKTTLTTNVAFDALAADAQGSPVAINANLDLVWRFKDVSHSNSQSQPQTQAESVASEPVSGSSRAASTSERKADPLNWEITTWKTNSLSLSKGVEKLFVESLDAMIPNESLRNRLRHSQQEEFILAKYAALKRREQQRSKELENQADASKEANNDPATKPGDAKPPQAGQPALAWESPHKRFSVVSQDRHPAVSIVDIDQDGFEDIYVMSEWEPNVMLRNNADGTFEDIAPQLGLDIHAHCASAIFADIDNDGDPDLVLGRTLERSQLLINENGKFVDRSTSLVSVPLPYLVSSVSVADYNNDGLLDIYFATYAANMLHDDFTEIPKPDALLSDFLTPEDSMALGKKINRVEQHRYLNYSGPPNLLLANVRGGKFEPSPHNENVQGWRHTYQASWSDFDQDGDADLYLANDFAVNDLFRNDGDKGFVNVAIETNSTDIGFGMGASWGDYDNNGQPDLYVSNMFSKAGRRITSQLDQIDDRFARMAGGNTLFNNSSGKFTKVSGTELPKLLVEKGGWSWGSQFVDVNNDGFLDVYALSGYYTAPASVAVQTDL